MAKKQRDQISFRINPPEKRHQFVGKVKGAGLQIQQVLTDLVDEYLGTPSSTDMIDVRHLDDASLRALQVLLATSETKMLMRYLADIIADVPDDVRERALRMLRGNLEIYRELVTFEGGTQKRKKGGSK